MTHITRPTEGRTPPPAAQRFVDLAALEVGRVLEEPASVGAGGDEDGLDEEVAAVARVEEALLDRNPQVFRGGFAHKRSVESLLPILIDFVVNGLVHCYLAFSNGLLSPNGCDLAYAVVSRFTDAFASA